MAIQFDSDTIEQLRKLPPRQAFERARDAVYGTGDAGSNEFQDIFDQLISEGILSRLEIEEFESR